MENIKEQIKKFNMRASTATELAYLMEQGFYDDSLRGRASDDRSRFQHQSWNRASPNRFADRQARTPSPKTYGSHSGSYWASDYDNRHSNNNNTSQSFTTTAPTYGQESRLLYQPATQFEPTFETSKMLDKRPSTFSSEAWGNRFCMQTMTSADIAEEKDRGRRNQKMPPLGQPGAADDPLRRGLSGAGCKWYLRYLERGLEPREARERAEAHRAREVDATSSVQFEPMQKDTEMLDYRTSIYSYAALRNKLDMKTTATTHEERERNSTRRAPKMPPLGQPGAFDDPLRRGLSGSGCRWYLRYLEKGLEPIEARKRAEEHRNKEVDGTPRIQYKPTMKSTEMLDDRPSTSNYPAWENRFESEKKEPLSRRARRKLKIPPRGQPGSYTDPLRQGLSGSGRKWYLRYLESGLKPEEARRKAEEHRYKPKKFATLSEQQTYQRGGKINTQESKRRKFQKGSVKESTEMQAIRIKVMPDDYANVKLTSDELSTLEEAILCEVAKGWSHKLQFEGIYFRDGHIIVDCKDTQTADWLRQVTPNLSAWKGPSLITRSADKAVGAHITFYLRKSLGQTTEQIMALISAQNDDLDTSQWHIQKIKEQGSGKLMTVAIDDQSRDAIKRAGNVIRYRFGKIPVQGLSKLRGSIPASKDRDLIYTGIEQEQLSDGEEDSVQQEFLDHQDRTIYSDEEEQHMLPSGSSWGNNPFQ